MHVLSVCVCYGIAKAARSENRMFRGATERVCMQEEFFFPPEHEQNLTHSHRAGGVA